nr:hypothetical protein [Allorhizocola rhizosphaerae]
MAAHDADGAQEFFGELFGWTFAPDPVSAGAGMDYRLITYRDGEESVGGIFGTGGQMPDHAVFSVVVVDVAETCASAQQLLAGAALRGQRPHDRARSGGPAAVRRAHLGASRPPLLLPGRVDDVAPAEFHAERGSGDRGGLGNGRAGAIRLGSAQRYGQDRGCDVPGRTRSRGGDCQPGPGVRATRACAR